MIPLDFIIDGTRYSKELDGLYHIYFNVDPIIPENSIGIITIEEATNLLNSHRYRSSIMIVSNKPEDTTGGFRRVDIKNHSGICTTIVLISLHPIKYACLNCGKTGKLEDFNNNDCDY